MKTAPLKLCVVTGSRAEYGLLSPLLKLIKKDKSLHLQVVATGMHLSPEFGLTYIQIEEDGFVIDEKVEMLLSGDTNTAIIKATGLGMISFADTFNRLKPDWIILLVDRFEAFAAAASAHLSRIPIAHLHGGELTEGATDDAMRHAISKMSYVHFTATETYRKRVIQLGEEPKRVFNVGAIALDNISKLKLLTKSELENQLAFSIDKNTVAVTFHPVTMENNSAKEQMKELLSALDQFPAMRIIFTLPNADENGRVIIEMVHEYVNKNNNRAKAFTSLGHLRYLSLLNYVQMVIGNSSSGILEAPYFKIPTVNIGHRQTGRIKPSSVIDASPSQKSIVAAIRKALLPSFRSSFQQEISPYKKRNTAVNILKEIKRTGKLKSLKKSFFDLT